MFLLFLPFGVEMALRGGDHRQVEDTKVQGQFKRRLQEESPQPEASQRLRQQREGMRLRRRCFQTLQNGATLSQAALLQPA